MPSVWTNQLRQASFRGVKFFIESHEFGFGRRSQLHEFPDRDKPFAEDLGRSANKFSIEGHILGDDYFTNRNAFIAACEEEGPGELIHPYLGSKFVQVSSVSLKEDTKQGRICTFTAEFQEAGEAQFPAATEDSVGSILATGDGLKKANRDSFIKGFDIFGLPQKSIDSLKSRLRAFTKSVDDATKPLSDTESFLDKLRRDKKRFDRDIDSLISRPGDLWDRMSSLVDSLVGTGGTSKPARVTATRPLVGFARPGRLSAPPAVTTPTPKTPSSEQAKKNEDLIHGVVRQEAIRNIVADETQVDFASVNDAIEERAILIKEINLIQVETSNDEIYQALQDTKAILVKTMPNEQDVLPVIQTVQNRQTVPAIVMAYDLFEDSRKESDIVNRNNIRHPGFVCGGIDLEVLSA